MNIGASRGAEAQACDRKRDMLWLRLSLEEIKYLIFLFSRSGVVVKLGVEFRHSTRNAFIIRKFGSRLSLHSHDENKEERAQMVCVRGENEC